MVGPSHLLLDSSTNSSTTKSKGIRYETKGGGLLIQSDTSRNREHNTELCFQRLVEEIKSKVYFASEVSQEDKEKWQELEEDYKERKNLTKKQSDKKKQIKEI